jgi:hypothetical protein
MPRRGTSIARRGDYARDEVGRGFAERATFDDYFFELYW